MNYLLTDAIIKNDDQVVTDRLDALSARAAAGLHHERQPRRDGRCEIRDA
ncbi:MAG: hypothetical protein ACLU3I_00560 [Acutalibacteraceae bacterium]